MLSKIFLPNKLFLKNLSSTNTLVKRLQIVKYGDPTDEDTLKLDQYEINQKLNPDQLLLKLKASAVNPADINVIQGKYGHLPKSLPETIGNEGLFEVVTPCSNGSLKEGDWVVVKTIGIGTWCSHLIARECDLIRMDKRLGVESAATMLVNPVTAFLLLNSIVKLVENESVLINAPTSTVGKALIQLCKIQSLKSICILRDEQFGDDKVVNELKSLGANWILSNSNLREKQTDIPKSRLALNCVGGKHATDMMRLADKEATMVTYGGLSMQPLTIPTGSLIFRDQRFIGFWLSLWRRRNCDNQLLEGVISELTQYTLNGNLKAPSCCTIKLENYRDAFNKKYSSKVLFG